MSPDDIDVGVLAYREDGVWQVQALDDETAGDLDLLLAALRARPSESGVLGLVAVDEDFFVIVRVFGDDVRAVLSDVTAIDDWPLASDVADLLDLPDPDEDDEPQPGGDLDVVADLGMSAMDLAVLCDDDELYPDEMLGDVATRIGFGEAYARLSGSVPA